MLTSSQLNATLAPGGPQRPPRRRGVRQEGDLCTQTAQAPQRGWMLRQQVSRNEIVPFLDQYSIRL